MDGVEILHLHQRPGLRLAAAALIHAEFWTGVPGATPARMAERLLQARTAQALPLCLVAVRGTELVGVVNLVDNDDDDHPEWHPWLAGMVVAERWRGQGAGSALVRALCAQAWGLGFQQVYFGTDGPGFYERMGAVHHLQPREGFWFMRFDRP